MGGTGGPFAAYGGSLPLGHLHGIPIRLHVLFLAFLAAEVLGSYDGQWRTALFYALLLGPLLLLTVLVHELGHCLATNVAGGTVQGVLLWPLGGLAFIGHTAGPKADMMVAAAGPMTHIPMTALWLLLLSGANKLAFGTFIVHTWAIPPLRSTPNLLVALCAGAVWMNISLLVFNLCVPAYPLDGGRLLADGLLLAGLPARTAAWATAGVAAPMALAIAAWGVYTWRPVAILIGVWVAHSTWELVRTIRRNELSSHPLFCFGTDQTVSNRGYVAVGDDSDPFHPPA